MSVGYVLDDTVLRAYAQGDANVSNLIAVLDLRETRVAVPLLALAASLAGLSDDQRAELNGVVDNLESIQIAALTTTADANELADVLAAADEPVDPSAAHTVAVARYLDWEIITTDRKRWADAEQRLPFPVSLVEFTDD
ncbi:hypothetical protein D7D52_09240 [Nocardia yunnanensis]|uniref:PIN domain-containing protein n=1 Tax=Nocardia yunnanensis TaxID=2382165 RepID=A0A386Z8Q0_9NOCA|nr:hypothetical protein [Nocardia yunnanensis]AYF74020.1 hypothetical protein D7D52_09240 [Nocardia yunnanensis]